MANCQDFLIFRTLKKKGGEKMVDIGLGVGEKQVKKYYEKTIKRQHGQVFRDEAEVQAVLYHGEKAVVIFSKDKPLSLYGKPSRNQDEIDDWVAGATQFYSGVGTEVEVRVIEKKFIPY